MKDTSIYTFLRTIPKNTLLYLSTVMAYGMAVEGIGAVLLNLYLLRLGYGPEFIGALNSAGLFVFAIASLPIGAVTRYSSRRMMQAGLIVSTIGLLGLATAQYSPVGVSALLIGSRIVAMLGLSFYFVHQIPFSLEITERRWHSQVMSVTMASFSLAAFIGSWIGGLLPQLFGSLLDLPLSDPRTYQMPLLAATLLLLPAIVTMFRIEEGDQVLDASAEPLDVDTDTFDWRPYIGLVAILLIVRALQTTSVGVTATFYNVYFDDALNIPTSRIGLISGLGRLLGVPMSFTIPWLVGRFGNFRLIHISLGIMALLMLPLALVAYWPVAAIALIAINSMASLRYLSFVAFTMSLVPDKQRSLMSGAGEMAIGAGFAISSFAGGYIIAWYGYRELFLLAAAATSIGIVAFWLLFRKRAAQLPTAHHP